MAAVASSTMLPQLSADERLLTAEEYYATCHRDNTELIDGKVVELMPPGEIHGDVALIIGSLMRSFVKRHDLGRVYVGTGFRLQSNPDKVRAPDVSFLEKARLPQGEARFQFVEGAPKLAVEIISPGDLWSEIEDKVQIYLQAGSKAVWLVDTQRSAITVRRSDSVPVTYIVGDIVPGGEVLPGFELAVQEIFE